jgi:hypothetical protein
MLLYVDLQLKVDFRSGKTRSRRLGRLKPQTYLVWRLTSQNSRHQPSELRTSTLKVLNCNQAQTKYHNNHASQTAETRRLRQMWNVPSGAPEGDIVDSAAQFVLSWKLTCSQCIRPISTERCERCILYKHPCDLGDVSNRARLGQRRRAVRRASSEQVIPILYNASRGSFGVYQLPQIDEGPPGLSSSLTETPSSQTSTASSPDYSDYFQLVPNSNAPEFIDHHSLAKLTLKDDSFQSLSNTSDTQVINWLDSPFDCGTGFDLDPMIIQDVDDFQSAFRCQDVLKETELIPKPTQLSPQTATMSNPCKQRHPGLTNLRPSRLRNPSPFEACLENRIVRLWDCPETFTLANAYSGKLAITSRFGDIFSMLFRWSRQLAESGVSWQSTRLRCIQR